MCPRKYHRIYLAASRRGYLHLNHLQFQLGYQQINPHQSLQVYLVIYLRVYLHHSRLRFQQVCLQVNRLKYHQLFLRANLHQCLLVLLPMFLRGYLHLNRLRFQQVRLQINRLKCLLVSPQVSQPGFPHHNQRKCHPVYLRLYQHRFLHYNHR